MKISHTLVVFILLFPFIQEGKSQEILGKWYSKTIINEKEVHYLFDIRRYDDKYIGSIDIPTDNKFRLELDSVSYVINDKVFLRHQGLNLIFEGRLDSANMIIQGNVKKNELSNTLTLRRQPQVKRSQTIQQPIPYNSEDIYFFNNESTRLSGTITFPKRGNDFKAVVLVSGSGPQDRNEEILGHKPFEVLADYLTRRGIVVLRYDDRGYGKSEGQFRPAASLDYSNDA